MNQHKLNKINSTHLHLLFGITDEIYVLHVCASVYVEEVAGEEVTVEVEVGVGVEVVEDCPRERQRKREAICSN